jgi:hypothetical protein
MAHHRAFCSQQDGDRRGVAQTLPAIPDGGAGFLPNAWREAGSQIHDQGGEHPGNSTARGGTPRPSDVLWICVFAARRGQFSAANAGSRRPIKQFGPAWRG